MAVPDIVFVESTALFQLGASFENSDFQVLLQYSERAGCDVCITETNWLEYLRQRKEELQSVVSRLASVESDLRKYGIGGKQVTHDLTEQINRAVCALSQTYEAKTQTLHVTVIPTPNIDSKKLQTMSIECTPPFERKDEKGFRDAMAMLTMLEHAHSEAAENVLVISNDDRLARGFQTHARTYKVSVTVAKTFDDGSKHILAHIKQSEIEALTNERQETVKFLLQYENQIKEQISRTKELRLSEYSPLARAFMGQISDFIITDVKSVSLRKIENAVWKDKNSRNPKIFFKVSCDVRAKTRDRVGLEYLLGPRFPVGMPTLPSKVLPRPREEERTVEATLYGEATFLREGENISLERVSVDEAAPSTDVYNELRDITPDYWAADL